MIKTKLTKDPAYTKKDGRLEKILTKYDKYLRNREMFRRGIAGDEHTGLLDSKSLHDEKNYQLQFMREVLYNYLDKELKIKRED